MKCFDGTVVKSSTVIKAFQEKHSTCYLELDSNVMSTVKFRTYFDLSFMSKMLSLKMDSNVVNTVKSLEHILSSYLKKNVIAKYIQVEKKYCFKSFKNGSETLMWWQFSGQNLVHLWSVIVK